jgi:hypothetical protein
MRWRSAWKLAIATPNCFLVFMYSTVIATSLSIAPTASAQSAAIAVSAASSSTTKAAPGATSSIAAASFMTRSAPLAPSWVG